MRDQLDRPIETNFPAPSGNGGVPSFEVHEPIMEIDEAFDIRAYLHVLYRYRWVVLAVVFTAFLGVLIVSLRITPMYKATGRIEISMDQTRVTKFDDMQQSFRDTQEVLQTYVTLLKSKTLARRVVERLSLDTSPLLNPAEAPEKKESVLSNLKQTIWNFKQAMMDRLNRLIRTGSASNKRYALPGPEVVKQEGLVGSVIGGLDVKPERDTTIISLGFNSPDPVFASDMINAIIEEFKSWQVDKKIESSVSAKQHLEKELVSARIQLEKAEDNLNAFAQKAGIVSLNSNMNLIYSQLEDINKAFTSAQTERINKEALYKSAEKEGGHLFTSSQSENMVMDKLRGNLMALKVEYLDRSATYRDGDIKRENLKAKIAETEKQIKDEESTVLASLRNDYTTALKKEESLGREVEEKKALALQLNDQATHYKILEREVETSKLIHQSLLERSKEIDAKVGTELTNVQVVDYAVPPLAPFQPDIPRNLLIALFAGIIGGIGLAFFLENLVDNTIKRIDEVFVRFRIPVLGVLPLASAEEELLGLSNIVIRNPKAGVSEAIQSAKLSIQLSSTSEEPHKSLVVTSTTKGEGKSTIAANLAQAFAVTEERVLIIDADLRKPRLHKVFTMNGNGKGRPKGLTQYLSGICDMEEIIHATVLPNLKFINAGPIPPNPADLLASSRMRILIETLEKRFDRIIIDAPPATGFGDTLVLGNIASGVLFVSTLGQTHRQALRIFQKRLHNVRGRLIGCIINKLHINSHYGGYYYKYYSYYNSEYHGKYYNRDTALPPQGEAMQDHEGSSPETQ